jgi:hypothetical protein
MSKRKQPICHNSAYSVWRNIKYNCLNPNSQQYHYFGGAGITICDEWASSFTAFISDLGERPNGASLIRIDKSKGFSPDNCRWEVVRKHHQLIKRTIFIEYNGQRKSIKDWAQDIGLSYHAIWKRYTSGYPVELILNSERYNRGKPPFKKKKKES